MLIPKMQAISAEEVAVIVVNYNGGDYLSQCLAALQALQTPAGEIIVVDNASTDDSLSTIKAAYPDLKLIELAHNSGFAAANNTGIAATQKPWLALINPDAFVAEDWLETLLEAINQQPDIGFFSSELVQAKNRDRLDGQGDCYHLSGLVWRRKHGQKRDTASSTLPLFSPCAAAAMYRRDAVLSVGGFDEDYFCYIEDVDLAFRLRLAGHDCLHIKEAVAYHIGSGLTERESDFSVYHGHRNLVWTYFKNMPMPQLWRYLPQHLLMNIAALIYYSLRGRPRVIFKAKWHALKGLPAQYRKRSFKTTPEQGEKCIRAMTKGWLTPYLHRDD